MTGHPGRIDAEALKHPQLTQRGDLEAGAVVAQGRQDLRQATG
jgi:hypothetical protein